MVMLQSMKGHVFQKKTMICWYLGEGGEGGLVMIIAITSCPPPGKMLRSLYQCRERKASDNHYPKASCQHP